MTGKGVLEYILLAVILTCVTVKSLEAYEDLSHVDLVPSVKHMRPPAVAAVIPQSRSSSSLCPKIAMLWNKPGCDQGIACVLSEKDIETIKSQGGSLSEDQLQAFMQEKNGDASPVESMASTK